jgi:general secretion pathway protein G
MAFSRVPAGVRAAAGNLIRLVLRLVVRLAALAGMVVSGCWIVLALTTVCVIRKNQTQFVAAQFRLQYLGKALERYRADCGEYPDSGSGLKALRVDSGKEGWSGPYTDQPLIDPWGRPYLYEISNGVPIIRSLGADGEPGGDLYDSDLSSLNPMAPVRESKSHAARRYFEERVEPWLVFLASLYA